MAVAKETCCCDLIPRPQLDHSDVLTICSLAELLLHHGILSVLTQNNVLSQTLASCHALGFNVPVKWASGPHPPVLLCLQQRVGLGSLGHRWIQCILPNPTHATAHSAGTHNV